MTLEFSDGRKVLCMSSLTEQLQTQHDQLLAEKPEGVEHDEATCGFCNAEYSNTDPEGGDMKTYTEDEFTVAVKEAVAPVQAAAETKVAELQAKIDELTAQSEQAEVEGQIAEIQAKLDVAEAKVADAEQKVTETLAYFDDLAAQAAEAARLDTLRESRRAAIASVTAFSDEQIDAKLDRWVAMDDETFEAILDDFTAIRTSVAASTETDANSEARAETAMENVREERSSATSAAASIYGALVKGVDVRELNI